MRNISLFIITVLLTFAAKAQDVQSYTEAQDSLFQHLDKNKITTGTLYNRVYPWANLDGYNPLQDTIDYKFAKQAWHELYLATYNNEALLPTDAIHGIVTENKHNGQGISIGAILYRFNIIDSNAIINGSLTIDSVDSLYRDGLQGSNPYLTDTVAFAFIAEENLPDTGSVKFYFDPQLVLNNVTGETITQITIAAPDGGNSLMLAPGQSGTLYIGDMEEAGNVNLTLTFATASEWAVDAHVRLWRGYVTTNYQSQTTGKCVSDIDTFSSGSSLVFQGYGYYENTPTQGFGEYKIYYHLDNINQTYCDERVIKPVIIIDGFDPQDQRGIDGCVGTNCKTIWQLLSYSTNHLGDQLRLMGYDVIILNFPKYYTLEANQYRDGGADFMERNAMVLTKLIQKVNGWLADNNSEEEIVIIGPSMGGQIARYALKYMENNSIEHNTRLFIAFDSPNLGANIPLGLQSAVYYNAYKLGDVESQDVFSKQLRSVAARQLLLVQKVATWYGSSTDPVHVQWKNNINNMGYPSNLRKVALINGSTNGLSFGGCTNMLKYKLTGTGLLGATTLALITTKHLPTSGSCEVFYGKTLTTQPYAIAFSALSIGNIDAVPGGTFRTTKKIKDELKIGQHNHSISILKNDSLINIQVVGSLENYSSPNHTFIPSVSGLGFYNSNFNWANNIGDRNLVCTSEIPFDNYYTAPTNEEHVFIHKDAAAWVLEEIQYGTQGCPNICATDINGTNGYLCTGQSYTFTLNEPVTPGVTTVWNPSPGLSYPTPTNNSITVTPQPGSWGNNLYIEATITAKIGSNQCSGKKIIRKNISYGNIFSLQYTDVDATHFNVSVVPHQSGNQYRWAMDNINFGSLTSASAQLYLTKTAPLDPAEYFKVRVYPNGCATYYELQGQYWREGLQQPQPMSAKLELGEDITVSPNPSSTIWSVFLGNSYNDEYADIKVYTAVAG